MAMAASEAAAEGLVREIRALPALVVNQIAAGEVVERPASVVKELMENALDAGASAIRVEIEAGGVELVRVVDDGCGVAAAQAPLMLAPHATSKIRSASDLDAVRTMGFRGEALASIVSVSRVSVRSRERGAASAWRVEAEGDRVGPVMPEAGPVGTSVSVRNLFFNTPARRKFLRTAATEQQHCLEAVRDLALAHPGVAFEACAEGRVVVDLPGADSPRDRALDVLGRELESQLLEVVADRFDDARGMSLWGLAGMPSIARATANAQKVFVNGRAVRDRTVAHAVQEAYRGLIEPSRKPTALLLIEMSPEGVDVNVHPQKAEVRFRDSSMVHQAVLRAVREALRRADLTPATEGGRGFVGWSPGGAEVLPSADGGAARAVDAATSSRAAAAFVDYFRRGGGAGEKVFDYGAIRAAVEAERAAEAEPVLRKESEAGALLPGGAPRPASPVLQVHQSYLVTQDEQGLVIIDQHALHERVMFEGLLAKVRAGALESQRLLSPVVAHVGAARVEALGAVRGMLASLGVEAEAVGPESVAVSAFPTLLFERGVDAGEFVAEVLERAEGEGLPSGDEAALHEVLDMMACKAAVKAGDRMSGEELAALVAMREAVERGSNCPHGRPTTIRLTIRDLEKRFGRG